MGSDFQSLLGNCIAGLGFFGLCITLFLRSRSSEDNVVGLPQKTNTEMNGNNIKDLLTVGAQRLGLAYSAFLSFEDNHKVRVAELYSCRYSGRPLLKKGEVFEMTDLYCEKFLHGSDILAIDYASLSTWREHQGFKKMGIETYLGVAIRVDGELLGSLVYFDEQARENFFSSSEKEFIRGLGEKLNLRFSGVKQEKKTENQSTDLPNSESVSLGAELR